MKIHLDFDENLLVERMKKGSPLLFGIAWENEGIYYPANDWVDFGIVILGWWFQVAAKIPEELTQSQLRFMDGSYSIKVSYNKQEMTVMFEPDGLDVTWQTSVGKFRQELIQAAYTIIDKLSQMNIDIESQTALTKAVELLNLAIG